MPGAPKGLIVFDHGFGLHVQSAPEQIRDEMARVASSRVPLIKVVDKHGVELSINADHIRAFLADEIFGTVRSGCSS